MEAHRVVEDQIRRVQPSLLVGLALGSLVVSAAFAVAGKLKVANFIGQWVPSLLILATFDRLMQAEVGVGSPLSAGALPNGVAASRPGTAGVGTTVGGTAAPSTPTPGL
jgi:hypothetical protein